MLKLIYQLIGMHTHILVHNNRLIKFYRLPLVSFIMYYTYVYTSVVVEYTKLSLPGDDHWYNILLFYPITTSRPCTFLLKPLTETLI